MLKDFVTNNIFFGLLMITIILTYSVSLILATTVELPQKKKLQFFKVSIAVALYMALIVSLLNK